MSTTPAPPQCEAWQLSCRANEVVTGVVTDALGQLAKGVGDAAGAVITSLSTLWVDIGTPNLTTSGNNPLRRGGASSRDRCGGTWPRPRSCR